MASTPAPEPVGSASADADLVRRVLAGDPAAFGGLYDGHADRVYKYLRFRTRDANLAADLTQDVFVSALHGLAGLRQPEKFPSWLMQIAHNRLTNHWTQSARHPVAAPLADGPPADSVATLAVAPDPAERVADQLALAAVLDEAARLTDEQQEVLALRFGGGLSVREAAELTGRSEDAVKQLQHRALTQLRRRLADWGDGS